MRALLVFPATTYRADAYVRAAAALDIELVLASDLPLPRFRHEQYRIDLSDVAASLEALSGVAVDGVLGVDEASAVVAAAFAERVGLSYHRMQGVLAARDKRRMRACLSQAGVAVPRWRLLREASEPSFPCVVKPPMLSGSQGVIRADDVEGFRGAVQRVHAILAHHPSPLRALDGFDELLVEDFVAGRELAADGIMRAGEIVPLAMFDKPDPLDGPYFEETIYVTPSREAADTQQEVWALCARAAVAMELCDGPIHAEVRLSADGPVLIEIAARSIGGLCGSLIEGLEEASLLAACGQEPPAVESQRARGVMMIPVPRSGVLRQVDGLEEARAIAGIDSIVIGILPGEPVRALPEGASYLGFIFASGDAAERVEASLKRAHAALSFRLSPLLAVV